MSDGRRGTATPEADRTAEEGRPPRQRRMLRPAAGRESGVRVLRSSQGQLDRERDQLGVDHHNLMREPPCRFEGWGGTEKISAL